jgi:LacI family transcriptional regulator
MEAGAAPEPTLHDVARRAGVSPATVSRVLSGRGPGSRETSARVREAAVALGYRPPRRPVTPSLQHGVLAVVLPDLATPGVLELWRGCEAAAADRGLQLTVLTTSGRRDATSLLNTLVDRVDGFLLADGTLPDPAAAALGRVRPVALLGRPVMRECISVGGTEITPAARRLTDHLLQHGRQHLTFVGDPDATATLAQQYRGFRLAHAAAGIRLRRPPLRVPLTERGGIQVAQEVLHRRVKVDGIVCASDVTAVALVRSLQARGAIVPDQIGVVGIGDIRASRYLTPGLTTLRPVSAPIGRLGVARIHARILGQPQPETRLPAEFELVRRASCGCPAPRVEAHG